MTRVIQRMLRFISWGWEWQHLNNNEGDLIAFKLSPFIPITLGEQQLLFNFEVPLPQHAGLTSLNHSTGVGDTRLKLFWLIGTDHEFVRAIVPAMDAIAPTGDEDRGLGGGQWIIMPNVVFALQLAENFSVYPFFRYVHADDVQSNFVTEFPLPEDRGSARRARQKLYRTKKWYSIASLLMLGAM